MWVNELYKRWMGRTSRRIRRRLSRQRTFIHPRLEALEDRTLLSAPAPVAVSQLSESGASQFGGGNSPLTGSQFLGGSFDVSKQTGFGNFDPERSGFFGGAQVSLSMSGKVGLDASYTVDGGAVNATYNNIILNQNYLEPTPGNQVVYFTPQNTNVSFGSGSFSTTSPSVGAGVSLDANVNGSVGGKIMVLGDTSSGSTNFGGSMDQPLISYNTDGSLEIFGHSLQFVSSSDGDVSLDGGLPVPSVTIPVEISPGVSISVTVGPNSDYTGLQESLDLNAGLVEVTKALSVDGSVNLGSASQTAPSIALSSSTLQSGGAISAAGGSTFATMAVQMGPLVASLLGLPEAGALASTDTINAGPLSASITPVSFTLGPNLSFNQTGTVTPTNQLMYNFYTDSTETTPMSVDVTENGTHLGPVSSVAFTPGVDTIGINFTGTPITVQPTWTYGMNYTNTIDLDASLQGTLTVGELSAQLSSAIIPGFSTDLQLGPIYTQDFDLADATLATVYNNTFSIGSVTTGQNGVSSLPSFVIGNTFQPSLAVTATGDGNTNGSGSLRLAVGSANFLGGNSSTPEIINLGAGTYNLQSTDGGTLDITAGNVIIQGAGAGQTIINASGLNAGIFHVNAGASLTLNGVQLENGGSLRLLTNINGGAVSIAAGGTLTVNNSVFSNNAAIVGGAIYNSGGTLTVNNSTFTSNEAWNDGGAIYNSGTLTVNNSVFNLVNTAFNGKGGAIVNDGPGTTNITNSIVENNEAINGGGFYNSSDGTLNIINSTLYFNEAITDGGGVYNSDGTLNIINSTLDWNIAQNDGGGLYLLDQLNKPVLINDTITLNLANTAAGVTLSPASGGGIYVNASGVATPYLRNTIVAGNGSSIPPVDDINGDDINGTVDPTSSYNLIGKGGSGGLTNGSNGNQVDVSNLGFGTFNQFHLLVISPTVTLLPGSPAIDAGSNALAVDASGNPLTTDQRGFSRVINGTVDIGAEEFQSDLALDGGFVPGTTPGTVVYSYNVLNNGPDSVAGATLSVPLPQGTVFQSATVPTGWTETDPDAANNFTATFTETGSLSPGQSTNFTITVQLQNSTAGTTLTNTATVASPWDNNLQNNSVTLAVTDEQEGRTFNKALLYHFTDANANATANTFTATVNWGDNSNNNISNDGTGTVSVVADPSGGFDVLGSHTFVEEGNYGPSAVVTGLDGTTYSSGGSAHVLQNVNLAQVTVHNTPNGKDFGPVTATVDWGDGSTNTDTDGSDTVSVVSEGNKVFAIIGYHVYPPISGSYTVNVTVGQTIFGFPSTLFTTVAGIDGNPDIFTFSSSDETNVPQQMFVVADAPLTAGTLTPPANATINQPISSTTLKNIVLYHFTDPTNPNATASDFTASVGWGDNLSNTSSDNTGTVSVVADSNGGFDVVGVSHTYAQTGSFEISVSVAGSDSTTYDQPNAFTFNNGALLFHFTDADPNATASDYTATVQWGDGTTSTITSTPSSVGQIVANPSGGFDVYGAHTYTSIVGWPTPATFSVTVNDEGGSSTGASDPTFKVLYADSPLTAGTLNVPSVTTEGESISNKVLFHFSDADADAQASDYLATVSWGDGTFNNSNDVSSSVRVVANTTIGGFDVVGSHVYTEGSFIFGVMVKDEGNPRSAHPDNGGQVISASSSAPLDIAELPVIPAGAPTFTTSANTLATVQTVATFTDPGGPESDANAYVAIIQWGDGTVTATTLNAQANYGQSSVSSQGQITGLVVSASNVGGIVLGSDGQTFSVNLAHQYAEVGAYTITTTIRHGGTISGPVTTQAVVADQVAATGGFSIEGIAGISTGNQTVATFTDPEGAGALSDYSASINWGDGTASQPDISSGTISFNATTQVFTVSASHTYVHAGASYTITVVIDNLNAFPATVGNAATITQATPTVPTPIVPSNAVYNGQPQGATVGDVAGVNSVDLGAPTLTYYRGTYTLATLPSSGGSSTAPTDSGNYTVVASYAGSTDYKAVSSLATYSIGQATPAVPTPIVPSNAVYNGQPQGATVGNAIGVNNTDLGAPTLTYYAGTYTLLTLPNSGGSSTAPTNSGNYTVVAHYAGSPNYKAVSSLATYSISPAKFSYTIGNDTQAYGYPANLAADLPSSFSTGIDGETLHITYSSSGDTSTAAVGAYAITGAVSNGSGLASNYTVTLRNGTLTVLGSGVTVAGTELWIVGGGTTNDNVQVNPTDTSNTGSTGVKVNATLNHVHISTTYNQSITALHILLYGGNDNIQLAKTLTINATIIAGNGNDNLQLDNGNNTVMLGNGNDNVQAGDGNNTVTLGNGNDNVQLGNGNNNITTGNGNDNEQVGNGNNVMVTGNGNNNIQAGNGDNLIAAGLGHHNVQVGNGSNILIDGSVDLPITALSQVLNDWIEYGNTKSVADYDYIQQTLSESVTYNTHYTNTLHAGSGLDWFWAADTKDHLNIKKTDLLN